MRSTWIEWTEFPKLDLNNLITNSIAKIHTNFSTFSHQLEHMVETGAKLSIHVPNSEFLGLPLDDGQMTPDSVLSMRTDSGSSSGGLADCMHLDSTATTEAVKGKRSVPTRFGPGCRPASEYIMNRRKGTPHRSPLHWCMVNEGV